MLKETKLACRVTATAFDSELVGLIEAGAKDLQVAGIDLGGVISFTIASDGTITDNCTVSDALVKRAIITYVRMYFGTPVDYDKLAEAYTIQKTQLMYAKGYTDYGDEDNDEE